MDSSDAAVAIGGGAEDEEEEGLERLVEAMTREGQSGREGREVWGMGRLVVMKTSRGWCSVVRMQSYLLVDCDLTVAVW